MLSSIILMAPTGDSGGGYQSLIFLGLIMVVFYFFLSGHRQRKPKT